MMSLEGYLLELDDPRLTSVRVLGHLPHHTAIILEVVPHPTLAEVARRAVRRHGRRALPHLAEAYGNAGRLLRAFHSIPPPSTIPVVRSTFHQVLRTFETYIEFLSRSEVDARVLRRADTIFQDAAAEAFAETPPTVWCHGDFAPRNVFAAPRARVATFDVIGARAAPPYEDVAYFTLAMVSGRHQVLTQGGATIRHPLEELELAFLRGYFGETVPLLPLQTYSLLLLLDRWASLRARRPFGFRRPTQAMVYRMLTDRFFSMRAENLIAELSLLSSGIVSRSGMASR